MLLRIILLASLIFLTTSVFDILDFGAIPHSDTVHDQFKNSEAILRAIKAANASMDQQRAVRIPNKKFFSMPIRIQNVHNITIQIVGKLIASKNVKNYPKRPHSENYQDFVTFYDCTYIQISGGGKIDGRGYHWWMLNLFAPNKYLKNQNYRPHLLRMTNTNFTKVHDIILKNPGQWTFRLDRCNDGQLYNIDIKTNTTAQFNLIKKFSIQGSVVMFPFNTDGIDPSGQRFHIYNITCQNWDDVVVPKPNRESACTQDIMVQNCTVVLGVGMSVGSVPPNQGCNCARNITFRNVQMKRPLKGIYVKTNPGNSGTGIVQNILYQNFTMYQPIWWAVYIGPQQMKEPDGDGPGCMLYPFDPKGSCSTQPRVTLRNITLKDVDIRNSLLYPYTIRCNVTNPCKDINFYNVRTDKWLIGRKQTGYVCDYAMGKRKDNYPPIHCLDDVSGDSSEETVPRSSLFEDAVERTWNGFKVTRRMFEEMERAVLEVGYNEEDDDFTYDLAELGIEQSQLALSEY